MCPRLCLYALITEATFGNTPQVLHAAAAMLLILLMHDANKMSVADEVL